MSTTFAVSRDDCINRALRLVGAYDTANTPQSPDYINTGLAFNIMIKAWIRKGQPMWKVKEIVLPLLANQLLYQIGPYATGTGSLVTDRILKIQYAFVRNTSLNPPAGDTPIEQLSIQEYNQYGSKGSLGVVNSMHYRPLNDTTTTSSFIQVYPTPNDAVHELHLFSLVTLNDVSVGTDPVDFPQECYMALTWNLADQIALEYRTPFQDRQEIQARAAQYYEEMVDWSQENTDSIRFMYDTRSMG